MRLWIRIGLLACAPTIASCASSPTLPAAPRIEAPPEARRTCEIHLLPERPTLADLEIGYATRGAQIAACDAARRLAVQTHDAEHALEEEARRPAKRR
jgi:hypothetical protein